MSHISNGNSTSSEIQVSTSFINSRNNDQTTVTTFKPPNDLSEHPNGKQTISVWPVYTIRAPLMIDNKPAPVILMAVNPLNDATVHEVESVPHEGNAVNGGNTEKVTSLATDDNA